MAAFVSRLALVRPFESRRNPIYFLLLALAMGSVGCASTFEMLGAGLAYEGTALPASQSHLDLPYRSGPGAHPSKHRLDLFLPSQEAAESRNPNGNGAFPTLLFIHGGGWTHGDRSMGAFGIEPIRNIGRFYAARGIATAVVSYRLQPEVSWRDQIRDVRDAITWTRTHITNYGGNPEALYLSGHSAGAWLAAWAGLADAPLAEEVDGRRGSFCGLILVSGAAYDLEDEQTYTLGASREYFETRFADGTPNWARAASIRQQLDPPPPPTLILSAAGEPKKLERQSDLLFETLEHHRPDDVRRVIVPGQNHQRILVSMSIDGDPVSEAALDFIAETRCPAQ